MFGSEMFLLKSVDGRYNNEMESMDMMLNYENNELLSSDFFDTIRSVENEIHDDFLNNSTDGFLTTSSETDGFLTTSSETSSHVDGCISPRNDISESERGSVCNDESSSPIRIMDTIDESLLDFLTPIQSNFTLKEPSQPASEQQQQSAPVIVKTIKPSRIIIQNPNNKKIINKQIVNPGQIKKLTKKQILKVQPITTNGKPVILPCGLKNIKILNVNDLKSDRIHVTTMSQPIGSRKIENKVKESEVPSYNSNNNNSNNKLNEVKLTPEERRLLEKEGIQLPAYHPLTKMEDRELKRIRRKIRNKISAQDSRKRKKEYVDGLEEKVRRGSEENRNLMARIRELQKKNKTLMAHINKLQSLLFNSSTTSKAATPSTCLMIVMLSVLLVSLPNINLLTNNKNNKEVASATGNNDEEAFSISRSLLSTKKDDDTINMEEFFVFNNHDDENNETAAINEFYKNIENMEMKYGGNFDDDEGSESNDNDSNNNNSNNNLLKSLFKTVKNLFDGNNLNFNNNNGYKNDKGFIEPDIDEYEPEPIIKKMKLMDDYHQSDENFVPVVSVQANVLGGEIKEK